MSRKQYGRSTNSRCDPLLTIAMQKIICALKGNAHAIKMAILAKQVHASSEIKLIQGLVEPCTGHSQLQVQAVLKLIQESAYPIRLVCVCVCVWVCVVWTCDELLCLLLTLLALHSKTLLKVCKLTFYCRRRLVFLHPGS